MEYVICEAEEGNMWALLMQQAIQKKLLSLEINGILQACKTSLKECKLGSPSLRCHTLGSLDSIQVKLILGTLWLEEKLDKSN